MQNARRVPSTTPVAYSPSKPTEPTPLAVRPILAATSSSGSIRTTLYAPRGARRSHRTGLRFRPRAKEATMVSAYVLVSVEPGNNEEVVAALRGIQGMKHAHACWGAAGHLRVRRGGRRQDPVGHCPTRDP